MLLDLLPNEISEDITRSRWAIRRPCPAVACRARRELPGQSRASRPGALRIRNSNPEVAEVLSSQSDIDANAVQSSYTILNVFIWAIPILGFVGTVSASAPPFRGSTCPATSPM